MSEVFRCAYSKIVDLDLLQPNPENPNKHPKEQIERLAKVIKYQGQRAPIVVSNRSGFITKGHGRLAALKQLGWKTAAVDYQDYDNEAQEYADIVADNAIASWAELQIEDINAKVLSFDDFDPEHLGIEDFKPVETENLEYQGDPDDAPEALPEPKVVRGEVYILGNHRLMCGDSTSIDDVEKLFDEKSAEICFTSPPYADQRDYNGGKELSTEHLATFIRTSFGFAKYFVVNLGYSRKNGEVNSYWDDYIKEAKSCGLKFLSWNIWDKMECGSIGNQTAMFGIQHEWIFVFGPNPKDLNRTVANKNTGKNRHGSIRNKDGSVSKIKNTDAKVHEFSQLKTITQQTPLKARNLGIDHPAMFPVEFPEQFIEAMTNPGDLIFEPFGGSGTTLIASEGTGRECVIMELDPKYCQVILDRWQKFTGKKAHREDGKPWDEIRGE